MDRDKVVSCLRIYDQWHEYARAGDVDELLALYHPDAALESPLVPAILDTPGGVCHGRAEIRRFLEEGTRRRPNALVRWYRSGEVLCDGRTLFWEYPRHLPADKGEQIDIAEVMEVADGQIMRHRIYWGWFGLRRLADGNVVEGEGRRHPPALTLNR